jgi:hypothetical protein
MSVQLTLSFASFCHDDGKEEKVLEIILLCQFQSGKSFPDLDASKIGSTKMFSRGVIPKFPKIMMIFSKRIF